MSLPHLFDGFSVTHNDKTNGVLTDYTFEIDSRVMIFDGDDFRIGIPPQVRLPLDQNDLQIKSIARIIGGIKIYDELKVEIIGNTIIVTFVKVGLSNGVHKWTIYNVGNPYWLKPTSKFGPITSFDINGELVQQLNMNVVNVYIQNQNKGIITQYEKLIQADKDAGVLTPYTIVFTPTNPIPPTGAIIIVWPETVEINDDLTCIVNTDQTYANKCSISDKESRKILITGVFPQNQLFWS